MNIIRRFMRLFFYLLYHPFAWSYDFVAWTVSLGRWRNWIESVIPFIQGRRVLELGHGPGHLLRSLLDMGLLAVGLDESRQMGWLTQKRLSRIGYTRAGITRGLAQSLPFPVGSFDTVVSSFPSEYIFETQTLSEAYRVLNNGGKLLVLPAAWITGQKLMERWAAGLFRVTGQVPIDPIDIISERLKQPFEEVGFRVKTEQVEVKSSLVLIIIAEKQEPNAQKAA
jgi:ubiquinone/menaquinone biosynthesis C-methylase UbiE